MIPTYKLLHSFLSFLNDGPFSFRFGNGTNNDEKFFSVDQPHRPSFIHKSTCKPIFIFTSSILNLSLSNSNYFLWGFVAVSVTCVML